MEKGKGEMDVGGLLLIDNAGALWHNAALHQKLMTIRAVGGLRNFLLLLYSPQLTR